MKRTLYILLILLSAISASAQRYPITITPMVTPPYTLNFREMTSVGSTMLMTTITVNDITVTNLPVKFHIKLTSPGITIENIATAAVTSMEFYGGESRILMGSDLAQYFQLNNLVFNGYSKEKYQKTGQIPGGVWKLTIEARHFYTGRLLSNVGSFTFWASVYDPPVLVSPANGVEAPSNPSLPLVLSWQASKHTGGTAPIQYTVKVWEMLAAGVPAQTVAQSGNPIYTATTTAQSHTLVTTGVPMKPSVHYCWQVVVSDPSNMAIINDEGKSEVREFTYMSTCPDVDEIQARVKGTQVDFMWDPTPRHDHFEVELLQEGGSSSVLTSYDDHFSYYDFERGTTWKVRIKGYCPGGLSSNYSEWTNFSIPQAIQPPTDDECPDCGCDDVDSRTITNFETMELTAGDTIKNRTGRTRFIIVNATPNGDGSYNGNFLLWMELWKVKFLCEYTNLKVNTDGVIVAGQWASVYNPALLGDPAQIAQYINDLKGNIAAATYNNTIRDTIALAGGSFQTIYINSDGQYMAVKADGTEVDVTKQLDEAHRTLVTDDEGHQMVVTDNGSVMSVEQYKATGSNKTLISESNAAKDKQVSTGKVTFAKADGQKYGFDAYSADNAYDAVYPALEGGYRPAYKSIAKWQTDVVYASPMDKVSFRNQMGAPYAVKNGTIELRGDATPGESPVYAHVAETDSTTKVVGKLNLLTFDEKQVQLCLVPVNGARLPNASELQAELNSIFAPAVASVTVTTHSGLTMAYANGQNFVHGGSGWLSVYNTDQKTAIDALTDAQDDVYYLFFVDNATKLDENDKPTIVAGYMPICRRYGFIYDNPTSKYVAHELAHGAFALHHTFSDESESYHAPQGTTPNLMDYSTGTTLNHLQWQWMHESHTNLLGFLDDEEESESHNLAKNCECLYCCYPTIADSIFDNYTITMIEKEFRLYQVKVLKDRIDDIATKSELSKNYKISMKENYNKNIDYSKIKWTLLSDNNEIITTETNDSFELKEELAAGKYKLKINLDSALIVKFHLIHLSTGQEKDTTLFGYNYGQYEMQVNINIVPSALVQVKPENDDYYKKYGFDDAKVVENQQAGYYKKDRINNLDYYVPWICLQPDKEGTVKLDVNCPNEDDYSYCKAKNLKGEIIKINGQDSIRMSNANNALINVKGQESAVDTIRFYQCINSVEKVVGKLIVECRKLKNIGTIRVIAVKRSDENDYPLVNAEEVLRNLNEMYAQTNTYFIPDSLAFDTLTFNKTLLDTVLLTDLIDLYKPKESERSPIHHLFFMTKGVNKENGIGRLPISNTNYTLAVIFKNTASTIAHEIGHNCGLPHIFEAKTYNINTIHLKNKMPLVQKYSTRNIMDYVKITDDRKYFFKYQIDYIYNTFEPYKNKKTEGK